MRKSNIYFYAILGLCIVMLSGCGRFKIGHGAAETPEPTKDLQEEAQKQQEERFRQTIMRVGECEVTYGEAVLYMQSTKEEVEALYGREIWNYVMDDEGTTYAAMLKEELRKQITHIKLVCAQAEALGISLTEDEMMDVNEYTDQYLSGFSSSQMAYYGITKEMVRGIYADNLLATKIYESLTLNVDTDVEDEEARHPVLWYLFIAKYGIEKDGSHREMTEDELEAVRSGCCFLEEQAKTVSDFYAFAKDNTDDTDEIEIIVGRGDMFEELEKAAFDLLEGQTSPLIETEDGYFLLHCKSYMDEDATEQAKVEIILERQDKAFSSSYSVWEEETAVWVDQALWDGIDITAEKCE